MPIEHHDPSASSYRPLTTNHNNNSETITREEGERFEAALSHVREILLQASNEKKSREGDARRSHGMSGRNSSAGHLSGSHDDSGDSGQGGSGDSQPYRDISPLANRRAEERGRSNKRPMGSIGADRDDDSPPEDGEGDYPSESNVPEDDGNVDDRSFTYASSLGSKRENRGERCNDPYIVGAGEEEGNRITAVCGVQGGSGCWFSIIMLIQYNQLL